MRDQQLANPSEPSRKEKIMKHLKTSRNALATVAAAGIAGISSITPAAAFDGQPEQPPGFDFVSTLIGWALYIAAFVLFIYFIIGIVHAAKARRHGDEEVTAPLWPLVGGAGLGIAGLVWQTVVGV